MSRRSGWPSHGTQVAPDLGDRNLASQEIGSVKEGDIPVDLAEQTVEVGAKQISDQVPLKIENETSKNKVDSVPKGDQRHAGTQPVAAPSLPIGRVSFPPRVILVPPSTFPYSSDPDRERHKVDWEVFDAETGGRVFGDADVGLLRKLIADAGSSIG
jgi:hypothetical protein